MGPCGAVMGWFRLRHQFVFQRSVGPVGPAGKGLLVWNWAPLDLLIQFGPEDREKGTDRPGQSAQPILRLGP
jgi:hypothetical protein